MELATVWEKGHACPLTHLLGGFGQVSGKIETS
jgi:hypothetical protein